jgi:hypothetical protein
MYTGRTLVDCCSRHCILSSRAAILHCRAACNSLRSDTISWRCFSAEVARCSARSTFLLDNCTSTRTWLHRRRIQSDLHMTLPFQSACQSAGGFVRLPDVPFQMTYAEAVALLHFEASQRILTRCCAPALRSEDVQLDAGVSSAQSQRGLRRRTLPEHSFRSGTPLCPAAAADVSPVT